MRQWKRAVILALVVLTTLGPIAGTALAADTTEAQLSVTQSRFVSEPVETVSENGSQVYVARGQYLEITPENFNTSDVTDFTVRENEGVISFDRQIGRYVLNTQGNSGTYHVRWTVSEFNQSVIYTAAIRVVTADYAHVPQADYDRLRETSTRNEQLIQSIENSGDPDKPVEQKVEFGNEVRDFANNPFSALTGQFIAIQTLRFMTPAGWIDLGVTVALVYLLTRGVYGTIGRLRKQLEKEEQVSRREDRQYIQMFKQILAGKQMTDVDGIDDHQAAVLEDKLGPNLFTALRNFWKTWGADNLKLMYADAMGTVGYHARAIRDESGNIH